MDKTTISLKDVAAALDNNEFVYYYQPKVSMVTGEICGAEALLRWKKPDGTIIYPDEFIPLTESTSFINEITLKMFNQLIVDINIINGVDRSIIISFNASAKDFYNKKLIEAIRTALDRNLISADQLEIEITETALIIEAGDIRDSLTTISDLGISLAMDDFGTGFSNIETLAKWPFTSLKLDRSLVEKLEHSDKDLTIIQSSIQMAHKLELDIVAEGIESEAIYNILQNAGCTHAQGYWISRPIELGSFLELLDKKLRWPIQLVGLVHIAQLDHIQWRKAIIDIVLHFDQRDRNISGAPELDPTKCRLGKWYYGVGKCFAESSWYNDFETPHNRLHKIGSELLEAASQQASRKKILGLMRELTEQSIMLIGMLQELENSLMTDIVTSSDIYKKK
ncbi:diguanylate cyclase/phosphodiesterase (GGDEF & EAL domains) with PAS/PAC sensor(s) [hydrothermal vent metagenome]|uniref:Diguanylate cyclase/phosphodiesterase (GGDEF & EAL domains) with PAS/PAC sensor(S) n=1 Tax=hydrothermal vent metagenome TaxID=652676 RepID=A0A3B1AEV0_9ZZZZ